jgi:polysaccharide export outer membrane protein
VREAVVPDAPRVFVAGDVRHPGAYAWFPGLTAQKLVSLAGGVLSDGPEDRFAIVRDAGGSDAGEEIGLDAPVTAGEAFLVRRRPN